MPKEVYGEHKYGEQNPQPDDGGEFRGFCPACQKMVTTNMARSHDNESYYHSECYAGVVAAFNKVKTQGEARYSEPVLDRVPESIAESPSPSPHNNRMNDSSPPKGESRGECVVCKHTVWSSQDRVADDLGKYLHRECFDKATASI